MVETFWGLLLGWCELLLLLPVATALVLVVVDATNCSAESEDDESGKERSSPIIHRLRFVDGSLLLSLTTIFLFVDVLFFRVPILVEYAYFLDVTAHPVLCE